MIKDGTRNILNISDNCFSKSDENEGFVDSFGGIHNVIYADYFVCGKNKNQLVNLTDTKHANINTEIQEELIYVEMCVSGCKI